MSGSKTFILDPQDLYELICHYTDGAVPMEGQVSGVVANPYLTRMIGLRVESDEWTDPEPLHVRYEGKRTATWKQGQERMDFEQREETPRRQ